MQVELIRSCGTDLDVVNNAKVSFSKESKEIGDKEKSLLSFLARGISTADFNKFIIETANTAEEWINWGIPDCKSAFVERLKLWRRTPEHWAPFANGISATLRIKAPIFVARQLDKHQVGFVKSEVSRRYVSTNPEVLYPNKWRAKADNVKQGSSDEAVRNIAHRGGTYSPDVVYSGLMEQSIRLYHDLIGGGVCEEQARMVLPQSMYTEWIWTGSLYGWSRLCNQRGDRNHAQKETADISDKISDICSKLWPISWKELTDD